VLVRIDLLGLGKKRETSRRFRIKRKTTFRTGSRINLLSEPKPAVKPAECGILATRRKGLREIDCETHDRHVFPSFRGEGTTVLTWEKKKISRINEGKILDTLSTAPVFCAVS